MTVFGLSMMKRQQGLSTWRLAAMLGGAMLFSIGANTAASAAAEDEDRDLQAMSWASACVTCHGAEEEIEGSNISALAGMPVEEFMEKMSSMAASQRHGALMPQLARG